MSTDLRRHKSTSSAHGADRARPTRTRSLSIPLSTEPPSGLKRRHSESRSPVPGKGKGRVSPLHPLAENDDEAVLSTEEGEDASSDDLEDTDATSKHDDEHTFSGPLHYLPLIVAVVPPLGAILHGRAEAWTDALILLLVAFYLYQVVRVPWELYYASRTRRINEAASILSANDEDTPESVKKRRKAAAAQLTQNELISLALCMLSPFIGSYLLYYVRGALSEPERYINPFNVRLFVLASGVKPWSHLLKLIKNRSLFLQSEIHYPVSTVSLLMKRVRVLEEELRDLKRAYATKDDVRMLRDGVDAPLTQLSRAVKRHERKEEYLRLSTEEKFALLSERQEEMLHEIAMSAQIMEHLKNEQEKNGSVIRVLRHIFSGSRPLTSDGKEVYVWYEKGPFFYIFLPLIASNRIMDATGRLFEGLNKQLGSIERGGMIEDTSRGQRYLH